jgi:hypothetical protein
MVVVNSLIALILCSVVGAFTGLLLGGLVGDLYLAMIAGLLATIVAGIVRNIKIPQLMVIYQTLAIEHGIPLRLIIYSAFASLVGSVAAVGFATISDITWAVGIGALAGLFAGILMVMLMMVYTMSQGKGPAPLN